MNFKILKTDTFNDVNELFVAETSLGITAVINSAIPYQEWHDDPEQNSQYDGKKLTDREKNKQWSSVSR